MDFMIDTEGDRDEPKKDNPEDAFLDELFREEPLEDLFRRKLNKPKSVTHRETPLLPEPAVRKTVTPSKKKQAVKSGKAVSLADPTKRDEIKKLLDKSVITPDFEKLHSVPPFEVSEKRIKMQRRREREKTKGEKWYGLPATEVTEEVKHDLEVLQMRSALDPKHFYKKNDLKVLPKYFQIGKVMDSPLDFHNNRLTKKERKKTLVDELLADAEFKKYNKRKYQEIILEKQKTHYKAWRQAKRLKKKK